MSDKSQITYNRPETTILPTPELEKRYGIRCQDWNRCVRKLKKMKQHVPRFHLVYSFFFGVTVTSLSALITSYSQSLGNIDSWVFFVYWALFGVGLLFGSLFIYVDHVFRGQQKSDVEDLIEEMKYIEETFPQTP